MTMGFLYGWKKCSDCGDTQLQIHPKLTNRVKKLRVYINYGLMKLLKKKSIFHVKSKFWVEKVKYPPVFSGFKWTRKNISLWEGWRPNDLLEITEALPFSCGISFSSKFRFISLSWWVLLLLCKLNESSSWFLKS